MKRPGMLCNIHLSRSKACTIKAYYIISSCLYSPVAKRPMKSLSASWAAWSMAIFPAPPMVFSNWACFKCDLNGTFTEAAMAMLKRGLDIGYDRLTLDDCWMVHDCVEDGSLEWDTDKFPHGIPWLANYMKSNGLHLGIYQDPGLRIRRVGASLGGCDYLFQQSQCLG